MHADQTSVFAHALALPVEQRLQLADALLCSLNAPASPEIDRAWREERERRVAQIEAGDARLLEGEEAFTRLRSRLRR